MYNLYSFEKQLFENLKKESEETYRKKYKLKRKKEINNLSGNYDNRMKNFIFSMCENPVILNKNANEDSLNKTFNKQKFIVGNYKAEKKRVKEIEAYKNRLEEYEQEMKQIDKKRNLLKVVNRRDLMLIQPEMKYTSRTKLEKIIDNIKKEDMFKIDLSDASLLEKAKNNKFNKTKKIKEFYNLIDKDYLKDIDFKNAIKTINTIEHDSLNNNYSLENYMAWKYYHMIIDNDSSKEMSKSKQYINVKDIHQYIGNENIKNKAKNEYEVLVKDDFKTHFKGSSQYVQFRELKEENQKAKTLRNNYKSDINQSSLDKAITLALKNTNKEKSIRKEILAQEKLKSKTSRNKRIIKKITVKKALSTKNIGSRNQNYNNLYKTDYSFKVLNEPCKRRKLMMNDLIKKEIDKSLSKKFMKKYNSMYFLNNTINIPRDYYFEADDNFFGIKKKNGLDKKMKLLIDLIIKEQKIINNEKYYKYVKKLSKSFLSFKKKTRNKLLDDSDKENNKRRYIIIDGKKYPKKDIKVISDIIFKKCNYYNRKKETKD